MVVKAIPILIAICFSTITMFVALTRFIARDEGFYLYSAKLILEGFVPYRDFFLPQMPLMPYLYAGWFWLFGTSWVASRIFAGLLAVGGGGFVYLLARHIYGERSARVALLLLTVSAAFQVWMPLAKNTGLSCVLFLAALYSSLVRGRHAVAGFCMGLCILSRLTFGPLALLLVIPRTPRLLLQQGFAVCSGMLPAVALAGWWYGLSPENFILDNVTYHFQRTRLDEDGIADNKNHILLALLGLRYCVGGGGRQFCLLLLGAAASLGCAVRAGFEHKILVGSAALFFLLSFIPSPTYVQYFCVVVPLVAGPVAHALLAACDWLQGHLKYRWTALTASLVSIGCFVWLGSLDMYRYLYSGEKVIGVGGPNHRAWRLDIPGQVARTIDGLNRQNKPVYVSWPGYLLEGSSRALPGTENNFGVGWANNAGLEGAEAEARRVLGRTGIAAAYERGTIDVVALFLGRGRRNGLQELIEPHGAQKVEGYNGIVFYARSER